MVAPPIAGVWGGRERSFAIERGILPGGWGKTMENLCASLLLETSDPRA